MKTRLLLVLSFIILSFFKVTAQTCTVNAGIPFSMCQTEGTEWTLFGNTNDPGGAPVPVTWSVISEPAGSAVTITTPTNETTTVTNVTVLGEYTFQLTGTCPDGSGTVTDIVKYKLEEPIGDPMLSTTNLQACNEGWIAINNFQSDVNYTWVAIDFPFNSNGIVQMSVTPDKDSARLWTYLNIAGGTGKVILYSQRNSCIRIDTVDATVCGDIAADAGADVYICGDSWVKLPEYYNPLDADEYRYMGVCGTQTWTQLSGPNTSTITYNPTYDNYWDGTVSWTGLVPGTYEFELEFDFGAPCNTITKDTVVYYVGSGGDCQNFLANRKIYTLCDAADSLYIDLVYDFGLDPTLLRPGDSIIWSIDAANSNCAGLPPPPPPNTLVFAIHRDDICDPCDYFITIQCEEGCSDVVEVEVAHQELDLTSTDRYYCTSDGVPVSPATQSLFQVGAQCHQAGLGISYTVLASPSLTPGTRYTYLSSVPPLGLGSHTFQLALAGNSGYPLNDDGSCHETAVATAYVQGAPSAANAGTDAILPCNLDSVILSANDPSLPIDLDVTGTWSIISGPAGAQLSDVNDFSPTFSGLILDATYCLKWSVGNNACGYLEDTIKVYTSSTPPPVPDAGIDSTVCHTNCITLYGAPMAGGVAGTWTVSPAAGITFIDPTSETTDVCGLAASTTYTFTWTATNGCGSSSDDVDITTNAAVGQIANAGPDICNSTSSTNSMGADPLVPGATGTWSVLCTKGGISLSSVFIQDVNDPNSNFYYNGIGTIYFLWEVSVPGCGITTDTVIFTREFGTPTPLSEGFCGGPGIYEIDWDYYNQPGWIFDTINYQGQAGVQFLTDAGTIPAQVYLPALGQYIFYRKTGYGDCARNGPINVSLVTPPPIPDAGPDQIVCSGNSFSLSGSGGPYGGAWNLISGPTTTPTIADVNDPNTTVSSAWLPGIYEFAWNSFPSDSASSACTLPDTVQIVLVNSNLGLGIDLSYCVFQDVILTAANFTGVGAMEWMVTGPMMPTIDTLTKINNIKLSGFNLPGTYTVSYTVTVPGCPPVTEDMEIVFSQPIADAGSDLIACSDTAHFAGVPGTEMQWSAIQGTGSFVGTSDTSAMAMYYPILYGDTVAFAYCITENGCENCDTVQVIGAAISPPSFNLTNITTCMGMDGEINILGLEINTTYDLYYMQDSVQQGPISITTDASGQYSITGLGDGTYTDIYVENEFACTSDLLGPITLSSLCTQDLGNYLWDDQNGDGIQDPGEPGVDGATVYLYEDTDMDGMPDGPPIDSVQTSGGGAYLFPDLFDGSYVLEFDVSNVTGYGFTLKDVGSDSLDSDVNNLGLTETITLCCGEDNMTVDAGISQIFPITLAYFKLEELNCNEVHLKWGTSFEENTSHFIIEQQVDNHTFVEVGRMTASGNSTELTHYDFVYLVQTAAASYYRIKSVDFDGTIQYSPTLSFNPNCEASIKAIYPNPTLDKVTIIFNHEKITDGSQLELMDALGRVISVYYPKEKELLDGFTMNLTPLSSGIYFIKVRQQEYFSKSYKIIKLTN